MRSTASPSHVRIGDRFLTSRHHALGLCQPEFAGEPWGYGSTAPSTPRKVQVTGGSSGSRATEPLGKSPSVFEVSTKSCRSVGVRFFHGRDRSSGAEPPGRDRVRCRSSSDRPTGSWRSAPVAPAGPGHPHWACDHMWVADGVLGRLNISGRRDALEWSISSLFRAADERIMGLRGAPRPPRPQGRAMGQNRSGRCQAGPTSPGYRPTRTAS
jgi:hypothetical protein